MEPVLTVRGARKTFEAELAPVRALRGVDLELADGEFVAIMGPSGCGKSTLLNLVGRLDRPTAGEIVVDGVRVDRLGEAEAARFRRSRVGFVFQFFHLLDELSVRDNVVVAAVLGGRSRGEAARAADEMLGQLGLDAHRKAFPATLSGGERQRVAIARAVVNGPAVLLADEPTGALDRHNGEVALSLLEDLNRRGQTILIVTHDEVLARRSAHRIVRLTDGRIAGDDATALVA